MFTPSVILRRLEWVSLRRLKLLRKTEELFRKKKCNLILMPGSLLICVVVDDDLPVSRFPPLAEMFSCLSNTCADHVAGALCVSGNEEKEVVGPSRSHTASDLLGSSPLHNPPPRSAAGDSSREETVSAAVESRVFR